MNDFETVIWKACREADEAFEKVGDTGTKCWIREYFLPSLERHGLEIKLKADRIATDLQVSELKKVIERKRDTAKSVLNNEAFGCAGSVMGILNDILGECFPDKPKEESPFPTASDLKVYRAVDKFMGACEAHRMTDCRHCVTEKRVSEPVKVCERCGGARPCRHGD